MRDYLHVQDLAEGHVAAMRFLGSTPGATTLNLRFVHHSVDHYCEQLDAMRALLGD